MLFSFVPLRLPVVIPSLCRLSGFHKCDLQYHFRQIQIFALLVATKRNYQSIWNTYLKFCHFYCLPPFPAVPATIATFATLVSFSVKSHHTINNYLSALRQLNVFRHFYTKAFDDIHVKQTVKGFEKWLVHITHRKAPLTPSILLQFDALVIFFTFFRTANLVPPSLITFSAWKALSRISITFNSSGAVITIIRRKLAKPVIPPLLFPSHAFLDPYFAPHSLSTPYYGPLLYPTLILSSLLFPPRTNLPASLPRALTTVLYIWLPSSLWTLETTQGIVCIAAVLHSPFSLES